MGREGVVCVAAQQATALPRVASLKAGEHARQGRNEGYAGSCPANSIVAQCEMPAIFGSWDERLPTDYSVAQILDIFILLTVTGFFLLLCSAKCRTRLFSVSVRPLSCDILVVLLKIRSGSKHAWEPVCELTR